MNATEPTVPEDGRARFPEGGGHPRNAKASKKAGPSGHNVQQQENTEHQQHQHGRREHRDEEVVAVDPNGGGSKAATVPDGIDADIGNEFVRQYYAMLYNAPEHVWRLYAEHAQYCDVHADGGHGPTAVAPAVQDLGDGGQGPRESRAGDRRIGEHDPVRRIRPTAPVMATSERFVQSFVVEFSASRSFAVVASVVRYVCVARPPAPAAADNHCVAQTADGRSQHSSTEGFQLFVGCLTSATTDKHL